MKLWRDFVQAQPEQASASDWKNIVTTFYHGRLKSRYFDPIKNLQSGPGEGEGFAIVAIQCSLIEFLESCAQGTNYRYLRKGEVLGPFEYSDSLGLFRSFLAGRDPFRKEFSEAQAEDFYRKVRCSILHEARTGGTWLVHDWHASGRCLEPTTPILYRDNFQMAIEDFAIKYAEKVPGDLELKRAFIRKFQNLCA